MTTSTESVQTTSTQWQRLSPWSVLHFLFLQLRQSVSFAIYIIPAYVVGGHKLIDSEYFPLLLLAMGAGWAISSVLKYYFFQFTVTDKGIAIRSGVLDRTFTDLPYERIQNVKFDQPFYFRFNDLRIVTLDTAGSAKQEAHFAGVTSAYAQFVKETVMRAHRQQSATITEDSPASSTSDEQLLNERSIRDLILHGITNNRVWIVLGTLAPFYEQISGFIFRQMNALRPQAEVWLGEQVVALWYVGVMSVLIAIVLLILMALFSIGGSVLMFYGYRLTRQGDKYIRNSGLLNRQEVSMKRSRVQIARQQQDWLDRLLGRVNLYFEQNVTGRSNPNELKATHKLLVPSVTVAESDELTSNVFSAQQARHMNFEPIHIRFFWRQLMLWILPLTVLASIVSFKVLGATGALPPLLILCAMVTLTYLRWQRWGIASDADYIYVRKGIIGIDYWCFPLAKVQQVEVRQSLFMRRRQLSTLGFVLASGRVKIPFVATDFASPLIERVLYEVEVKKPGWM